MPLRIEEDTIVSGKIFNKSKDYTSFTLVFTNGSIVTGNLVGNPHRDIAGRELTFTNPHPSQEPLLELPICEYQSGQVGDITAAKKVKVLKKVPLGGASEGFEWKNSLYLEWYSHENGRVVLEATDLQMTLSEAAWEMTSEEETAAHEAAGNALRQFFDQLCNLDLERKKNEDLTRDKETLNEFEWEKTLRFSDRLTKRYHEALEKFGPDGDGKIDEIMGWQIGESLSLDAFIRDFDSAADSKVDDNEEGEDHPLNVEAFSIVKDYLHSTSDPETCEATETRALLSLVVTMLAGALSCRHGGVFTDKGFTIANLKRVLIHIDDALRQTENPTRQRLLKLRQDIVDLQQELRRD